ncbi:2-succinyl-6-hydroxy-2,4-cyclohexadiene-1-carboxylate synthase [Jeotgalibaca dankookensis]|uniref:2-succinyl-6-hydroxy-2, 4-cyclohexadiene-1-carboxylate synthase n=1 Tax=Jeotgalibaca dankookensis TaxID=708126 RepID=A0A1S6IPM5_9LACT|nr:alpha/beta hydrolase [Jeotgalibaca dankookensis]AQS53513.1 2-succinyl-6-hydroxy-2,4-cyclohexadiene-1-carboxylate synthase [Jeotgalibaca dankookensis]
MDQTNSNTFTFISRDGTEIVVYKWLPKKDIKVKGIVQISHGMAETARRYHRFAKELNANGFIVYANDHRGHGQSAESIKNLGYLGAEDGFRLLVEDIARLSDLIKETYPDLPVYMFSHSMGSFAAQRFIMDYPNKIEGLILSGSNGRQGALLGVGKGLAKLESSVRGKKAKSKLLDKLIFGTYNKKFEPKRTGSEWLTRDKDELDKYIENPYCGGVFPASFFYYFIDTLQYIEDENNFKKIPKQLPILIISGDQDPVGDFGKGVKKLYKRYEEVGVKDLSTKLYEGARHELLNEINRDEVTADIVEWLLKENK